MKPDWKDAPEWAQYLAKDADGSWWWHEKQPNKNNGTDWAMGGKHQEVYPYADWWETLEARP